MTRPWMICASTAAFALGMTLVHCSSSSSTGTVNQDAGGTHDAKSTGSSPGSSTGSGSSSGSGTSMTSGSGSSSGSGSGSTTGSSSGSGSGTTTGSGTGKLTDTYDAGPCIGPDGGAACDPGNVECGGMQCAVPGHTCCEDGTPACVSVSATCTNPQNCDEKSDCPDGQICCLAATDLGNDTAITCQTGTTCPSSGTVASAQVCKTDAECGAGGKCSFYSCMGQIAESCQAPNPICTLM